MQALRGHAERRTALVVALLACALASAGGAPASDGVFWQGETPEHRSALIAPLGRELAIPLEASGPVGSFTRISARPLPAGARSLSLLVEDPAPSYEEIGKALAMPIGSIGPTRGRALRRLRRGLELGEGLDNLAA